MPDRSLKVEISATEFPHVARLVEFLSDVEDLAQVNADEELHDLIDARRDDLGRYRPRA
jgi:hypothetical protein